MAILEAFEGVEADVALLLGVDFGSGKGLHRTGLDTHESPTTEFERFATAPMYGGRIIIDQLIYYQGAILAQADAFVRQGTVTTIFPVCWLASR